MEIIISRKKLIMPSHRTPTGGALMMGIQLLPRVSLKVRYLIGRMTGGALSLLIDNTLPLMTNTNGHNVYINSRHAYVFLGWH